MCILYNQLDATYTAFFITISALHVSGSFSAHHQELIKLYCYAFLLSTAGVDGLELFSLELFSYIKPELIKLYVQPWVLSYFPAVYRWCGWVGNLEFRLLYRCMFTHIYPHYMRYQDVRLDREMFCFPGLTTHCGCIFSPVAGFSLLVFEVS
jgi:hypothetical protein